ncbi:MAG: hypothetical protein ABIH46_01220 [Chloroflexota bacterium]
MKKLLVTLAAIASAAAMAGLTSCTAPAALVLHENPTTAKSLFPARSLILLHLRDIASDISAEDLAKARSVIRNTPYASVPRELQHIIERYNQYSSDLVNSFEELEAVLDRASWLTSEGRLAEARRELERAKVALSRTERLIQDLKGAARTVANQLGAFAALAPAKLTEAYDQLQRATETLESQREKYRRLSLSLEAPTAKEEAELEPTEVTLDLDTAKIFVGESMIASGSITSRGSSLPNRRLTILVNGRPAATVHAAADGSYQQRVEIPYKYVPSMTVQASYTPTDNDLGTYVASVSQPRQVETTFLETALDIRVPDKALRGLPLTVAGAVTSPDDAAPGKRTVRVLLGEEVLASFYTQGSFSQRAVIRPQTPAGSYPLTIAVDAEGPYSGISRQKLLEVMEPSLAVKAPQFLFVPGSVDAAVTISPEIETPSDAVVRLKLGENTTVLNASEHKTFAGTLDVPLSLVLIGPQRLEASVEGLEHKGPLHTATRTVVVINLANIGIVALLLLPVGLIARKRMRGRPRTDYAEAGLPKGIAEPAESTPPLQTQRTTRFGDEGSRILAAYMKAAQAIAEARDVPVRSHQTLREFIGVAALNGAVEAFMELTATAERTLYSAHIIDMAEAVRAENLATMVEEVMKDGAS